MEQDKTNINLIALHCVLCSDFFFFVLCEQSGHIVPNCIILIALRQFVILDKIHSSSA